MGIKSQRHTDALAEKLAVVQVPHGIVGITGIIVPDEAEACGADRRAFFRGASCTRRRVETPRKAKISAQEKEYLNVTTTRPAVAKLFVRAENGVLPCHRLHGSNPNHPSSLYIPPPSKVHQSRHTRTGHIHTGRLAGDPHIGEIAEALEHVAQIALIGVGVEVAHVHLRSLSVTHVGCCGVCLPNELRLRSTLKD